MRNNTLVRIVQVVGFFSALTLLHSAQATQITITVPDCPSGQQAAASLDPSTNALTLSCAGGGTVLTPGNCTVSATPPSAAGSGLSAGTQVTLTASCTTGTAPIIYMWNNGTIASSIIVAPTATTTYSVATSNSSGAGPTLSTTVYIGTQTGTVPSGCAISQSPDTTNAAVASGTSVSLTVTCAVGMPLTSCSWTGAGIPSTTSCVGVTVAPTATTGYSVTASNSNGSASSPATTTVNVVSQAAGQNLCTSADQIINVAWPPTEQSQIQTRGFTQNTLAFKLAVPASFNPALDPLHTGYISMVEVPGAIRTARAVSVSRNSCDLSRTNSLMYSEGGTSPAFNFAVDNPTGYANLGAAMDFQPGQVYYINVENTYKGSTTCPIGKNCDILFNFKTPNSY